MSGIEDVIRRIMREEIRSALAEQLTTTAPTEWVSVRACGLPQTTRRRLTKRGQLPTSKIGRELFVRRSDVEKYFSSRAVDNVGDSEALDEFERARARLRRPA